MFSIIIIRDNNIKINNDKQKGIKILLYKIKQIIILKKICQGKDLNI